MNAIMAGQLDLLDLLPKPAALTPAPEPPLTCPGCGQTSPSTHLAGLNHWIHPADTRDAGHPVCIGMNLTRNHVQYWCMVISGAYQSPDKKCCHGAIKTHVGRERREYWMDHLRQDIIASFRYWREALWLEPMLTKYGIDIEEVEVWRERS